MYQRVTSTFEAFYTGTAPRPYGGYPTMAMTTVVDRQAIMIWQDRGGRSRVGAIDLATGKQLWRREVSHADDLAAGGFGFIVEVGGRAMVLAPNGRDITPPGLGDRRVYWTHDGNLILQRDLEKVVITAGMVEEPPQKAEVSLYSLATRKERPLGQHHLHGNCTGLPGRYVCAGKDGFVLIH